LTLIDSASSFNVTMSCVVCFLPLMTSKPCEWGWIWVWESGFDFGWENVLGVLVRIE